MVLPLLALAGVAGLMSGGSTLLQRHLQQQDQAANRQRMLDAVNAGMVAPQMVEAPRPDPSFVGPGVPLQQPGGFDPQAMAMELVRQGDPRGLELLSGMGQQQQGFQNQMALQQQRQADQWDRMLWQHMNQPAPGPTIDVPGLGAVPVEPVAIGSPEWMDISQEGGRIERTREIMDEFREQLVSGGTESIGARANKLKALQNEALFLMSGTTDAGALQDFEMQLFGERMPDVTAWTPEILGQQGGRLEAMADWYNNWVRSYSNRARFTGEVPQPRLFPSERLVPEGWSPVDESDIGPTPTQQRQERETAPMQVNVPTLGELLSRAEAGERISPEEWRGTY